MSSELDNAIAAVARMGVSTADVAAGLDRLADAYCEYTAFVRTTLESVCDRMGMPRRCLDEVVRDDEQ